MSTSILFPKEFGLAWNSEGYEAEQYIRARPIYPPILVDLILSYHRHFSTSPHFTGVADIGCGPGQLAINFSHHFHHTYGVDPSPRSLVLAESLQKFTKDQGAVYGLPTPSPKPIEYKQGTASGTSLPDQCVDLIVAGSCAHWWGLDDLETRNKTWLEFARILRPGGTVAIIGHRAVIGPARGASEADERIKNAFGVERILKDPEVIAQLEKAGVDPLAFISQGEESSDPLSAKKAIVLNRIGGSRRYGLITLPSDDTVWETSSSSHAFLGIDLPDDHFIERKPDPMPGWAPPVIHEYLASSASERRSLVPGTTTPKARAELARSASWYIRYLEQNPEEKALVASDGDWIGRKLKNICEEEGIAYEQEIEQRVGFLVVFFRRK